ncbi:hypothetical protein T440DRAFT_486196 [Plenodomus tracheiphilus IPT5]|uniref:Uncharacterized protein n=1 Tax=Plenodomus tracheiphilus IPT5 TaxID=1408161 RepID=A0A6A7BID7_9PLEO|nr:hypothetical protein T440DRAFT_486196 [Plenodomus tracheiphilus IPT5]
MPLKFVTATIPSEFKGEANIRIVRSQATSFSRATDYGLGKASQPLSGNHSRQDRRKTGKAAKSSFKSEDGCENDFIDRALPVLHGVSEDQCQSYAQQLLSMATASLAQDTTYVQGGNSRVPVSSTASWEANHNKPLRQESEHTKHDYENGLDSEELKMRTLVRHLARYSVTANVTDPLDILPRFEDPEIDAAYIIRQCLRAFVTDATMERWLPAVLMDGRLILSSTLITSGWLDMHEGFQNESPRTIKIKSEVYAIVGQYLLDERVALEDASVMAVDNLLMGEMWDLNEENLRTHQKTIADLVHYRGGMQNSTDAAIHEISAAFSYHADLICDTEPFPIFEAWEPLSTCPDPIISVTESPLFNHHAAQRESGPFVQLICDMRDLGDLFIHHAMNMEYTSNISHKDTTRMSSSSSDFNTQTSEIISRLIDLASASEPGHAFTDDWMYESCRIAALIYAAAIKLRISFPDAADPARNLLYIESTKSSGGLHYSSGSLSHLLLQALKRTDIANAWGDLTGLFYWVCIVGAMSARTTAMEQMASTGHDIWVRRCLSMHASRVMTMLVFQHPVPMAAIAKKLLKVRHLVTPTRRKVPIVSPSQW